MDSEDDMHDANDLESPDDDFYSGDTAMGSDDGDGDYDFVDNELDDSEDIASHRQQHNYTILSEADTRQRQEEDITRVSTVLSIPRSAACVLLRHYNWSVSKVHDEWFADEEKVRKAVGLLEQPADMPNGRELTCGICFESYPRKGICAAACSHPFCRACWRGYISTSISDGPGCLMLRCPDPSCDAVVGQDMINDLATTEDKEKYARYLHRSYIEDNRKTKWCPAPGCEYAVEFVMGSGSYDVCCNCSYSFCWNCTEEAHRPVDCGTVAKWILKNSAESENMNWILANSKPCPSVNGLLRKTRDVCISHALHLVNLSFAGYVLVHGQSMGRGLVVSMLAIAMRQQNRRERMMNLRGGEKWLKTRLRDTHIIMNVGPPISRQGKRH
uniref:RBR-type E3 ubiquitin transferase n=1 Tax=Ananas comosus var. bracteatus TaxID=296719 RepID=A0A6V7NMY9_ANACO|nr:unnamed protein product [Ananas comosus var. bracteatus]